MMLNPREYGFRPARIHPIHKKPEIVKEKQVSSACLIESEKTSREIIVYQASQPSLKISSSMEASMSSK